MVGLRRLCIAAALFVVVGAFGATQGVSASKSTYVVESAPWTTVFGAGAIPTVDLIMQLQVCQTTTAETCAGNQWLTPFGPFVEGDTGTSWIDGSNAAFAINAARLTDGTQERVRYFGLARDADGVVQGGFGSAALESEFFASPTPNGIDLHGFDLFRIGFRIDSYVAVSPEVWSLTGTWLFEGTLADRSLCMHGAWQGLERSDQTRFANQGDCIQYFNTAK